LPYESLFGVSILPFCKRFGCKGVFPAQAVPIIHVINDRDNLGS